MAKGSDLDGSGGDREAAGSSAMKKRFPMRATGERAVRCSAFLSAERKFRPLCVVFVFWLGAIVVSPAQLTTLISFNGPDGVNPYAGLAVGADGSLYGTTYQGGANGNFQGTVFKISPQPPYTLTPLHTFKGSPSDGAFPYAGLVEGKDGFFYGTTASGGSSNNCTSGCGTIFKISADGSQYSVLYSFSNTDGASPLGTLIQAMDGDFYGTTANGGTGNNCADFQQPGCGTIFKISSTGAFSVVHNFNFSDGLAPYAGLLQAPNGTFYGTTLEGVTQGITCGYGCGTVFQMTPTPPYTVTTLHVFQGPDGYFPEAPVILGSDSNFYGTTSYGGANNGCAAGGCGTIFQLTPQGVLTTVSLSPANGSDPTAPLLLAADGNYYGTTELDGPNSVGTVFQLTPSLALSRVYSFCTLTGCADGEVPVGGLVQLTGILYGTTVGGGASGAGTVFSLALGTNYILTVSISGGGSVTSTDGFIKCPGMCSHSYPPNAPVTLNATPASGSTFTGWSGACTGTGPCNVTMTQNLSVTATFSQLNDILTVSTNGSGNVTSTDGDINCPGTCGNSYPANTPVTLNAVPAQGSSFAGWSGACSGTGPCNVVMTQDLSVTATFTQVQGFSSLTVSTNGSGSVASTDGFINCPGTCSHTYTDNTPVTLNATPSPGGTFSGWSGACTGTGPCNLTVTRNLVLTATFTGQQDMVMHSFGTGKDGQNPFGSLISDSAGDLYGTTSADGLYSMGTVFEVLPNGTETMLYSFGSGNDGQTPLGNLIFDSAGNLYGTTSAGGMYGNGTVFELAPDGTETVLYSFGNISNDGQNPSAGLVFDSSGNLYGTTLNGGSNGGGTAFELSPPNGAGGWTETGMYSFGSGSNDGLNPYAGLVFDSTGTNLYGTTANGGLYGGGTVFELLPTVGRTRCCREMPIYNFGATAGDGLSPHARLIFDSSGNLYGTTVFGGSNGVGSGDGTAFELSPDGSGGWTETGMYSFGNGSADGLNPYAELMFDSSATNLYGTTANGGLYGGGTVFELLPNVGTIKCCREMPVYNFGANVDGRSPNAGVIFNASGNNLYGTTVSGGVHGGGTVYGIMPGAPQFVMAAPCRVVDTRNPDGTFGGPAISGGTMRSFPLAQSGNPCNVPSNVIAYSLNVTVVPQHTLGYLTIWPTGGAQPLVSTLNSPDGRIKANAAIVPAGATSGSVSVYVTDTTNVILDINGYFVPSGPATLAFYPLTPCRVVDTRQGSMEPQGLGPPSFQSKEGRELPILSSPCFQGLPSQPQAYSFNVTVVPNPAGTRLNYLTIWPSDQQQPNVSTLNNPTATVVANAAITPAAANGDVSVFTFNSTDVIIDTNGYFAAPGPGGYSFYPVTPCRAYDSRNNNGQPFNGDRTVTIVGSSCAPPSTATGYVFNATVVPSGSLGYLTLWPDPGSQPVVSTLNAYDGFITSNMAIVPNTDGSVDSYVQGLTQLILDISGYFAP